MTEQIAREAALRYFEVNEINREYPDENPLTTFGFMQGDYASYEGMLVEFARHVTEIVRAERANIDPDWQDDADDMRDMASVDISWVARDEQGRVMFHSDARISGAQAAAMFEAIGRAE